LKGGEGKMDNILKDIPIFSELSPEELDKVTDIANLRQYKKRMYVFMEGDKREAVYFIQSGVVKAYKIDEDGNEQVISLLHQGDMFPHVGFFDNSPYPATVEVVQDAELIVIRIDDFDEVLMKHPSIAIKVMKIMGQKILTLQERVQDFISKDVQHRIIQALVRLAEDHGEKTAKGIYIDIPITNQDFANMVGTSRESINRILNQFKKQRLLTADRQGILIHDLEELQNWKG
jgi:CRP/FNR family transcriptional regulator, cyclic AMP receptor protein